MFDALMRLEYIPVDRRKPESIALQAFRRNVTSQNGEDGVIAKIFELIGTTNMVSIEFGAAEGRALSNTWSLINENGWRGILIEGHPGRFRELRANYASCPRAKLINRYIDFAESSLDVILGESGCPAEPDFLSIDVDGDDWHIWHSLDTFNPRLVLIEFNPTIPNDVIFVPDVGRHQGCSLRALVDLGRKKGYELAATTDGNAFFVRADLFPVLGIADNSIDAIHWTHPHQTQIFQLYDGSVMLAGNERLNWQPGRITATGEIPLRSSIWAALRKAKHAVRWRLRGLGIR
jgi:hypothetical protein